MAIVKELIDRMGGTIQIDSVENQGTTIRVVIPFEIAEELQLYRKCLNYQRKICPGAVFFWQRIMNSTGKLRYSSER